MGTTRRASRISSPIAPEIRIGGAGREQRSHKSTICADHRAGGAVTSSTHPFRHMGGALVVAHAGLAHLSTGRESEPASAMPLLLLRCDVRRGVYRCLDRSWGAAFEQIKRFASRSVHIQSLAEICGSERCKPAGQPRRGVYQVYRPFPRYTLFNDARYLPSRSQKVSGRSPRLQVWGDTFWGEAPPLCVHSWTPGAIFARIYGEVPAREAQERM